MNALIVYFSRSGQNWVDGEIKNLEIGNTEQIACYIQKATNGDLFSLEMEEPYSFDYETCVSEAKNDQSLNIERKLKKMPDLSKYDVIYLGYPIYWEDLPSPVITLLKNLDFKGKNIYPFSTHEGSGLGASISHIRDLAKGANVLDPLPIPGSLVSRAENRVRNWVEKH